MFKVLMRARKDNLGTGTEGRSSGCASNTFELAPLLPACPSLVRLAQALPQESQVDWTHFLTKCSFTIELCDILRVVNNLIIKNIGVVNQFRISFPSDMHARLF